jgi:hypothetical protein
MSKKQKPTSQPRFHRMKRPARLRSAQAWLPKYDGKNVVRGYRKRYGVDLLCAIAELQMLNAHLDPMYVEQVRTTVKNQIIRRAARKKEAVSIDAMFEADTDFAYIAGYTEGGAPYGVTWEKYERDDHDAFDTAELPF